MRVALLDDFQGIARTCAPWEDLGPADVVSFTDHVADDDALVRRLAGFDVVVAMRERTPFGRERLRRLPDLRLLVTTGSANAAIDVAAAGELGIVVCGTGGLTAPTVELTWALILALTRHVPFEDRAMREGGWQTTIGSELEGRTLGVIGLGRLGSRVATIGLAFGMDVIAWSENLRAAHAQELGVRAAEDLTTLLGSADVVTIHTRLSDRTRGLVGAQQLRAMRSDAVLVNTSRGPIVDEAALVAALRARTIGGAALDVFDTEPLPPDHPLRTAPNTVLTPHLGYVSTGSYARFYGDAVEAIAAWRGGVPVRVLPA
jgi:phosphoglycerate dehydrogenase-like enzyme